jgi:hypothetical protein
MSHRAQVILGHQHRRHLESHGVGLGAASIRSFFISRARIGSTGSTGQLTVSFGGLAFLLSG